PYLHMTEWALLEEVGRWEHADDAERKALAQEWRQILDRRLKWRMSHEVVLDIFEPQRGRPPFMKTEDLELRVRDLRPRGLPRVARARSAPARSARVPVQDRHGPAGSPSPESDRHAGPADLRVRCLDAARVGRAVERPSEIPARQGGAVSHLRDEPRARPATRRRARGGPRRGSACAPDESLKGRKPWKRSAAWITWGSTSF